MPYKKFLFIFLVLLIFIPVTQTQDTDDNQEFIVHFGAFGPGNIALYEFVPSDLQIHRGDTVTWVLDAETNVHFEEEQVPLVVPGDIDGTQMPIFNPDLAFPTIESGATYSGGNVNSGATGLISLDQNPRIFSLTMDLEPGTYTYFSDIHVRSGTITVVADDVEIPNSVEVAKMASNHIEESIDSGMVAYSEMLLATSASSSEMNATVTIGLRTGDGSVYVRQFFPSYTVIHAGETVTWEVPAGNRDAHTVTWPPISLGQLFTPFDLEADPPVYTPGPTLRSLTADGDVIAAGDPIHFVIGDSQSVTLTFADSGVYPYVDNLHSPGMSGLVVVLPAE